MRSSSLFITTLCCLFSTSEAFSVAPKTTSPSPAISRNDFFQQAIAAATATATSATVLLVPSIANADVTSQLAAPAALRLVKRSRKKLSALELVVSNQDYEAFKASLRADPISDLRKSCSTIIRAAEDSEQADAVLQAYKKFVTNLEKADGLASLAMRGRKLGENEFAQAYQSLMESLDAFVVLADTVVDVPDLASS